MKNVVFDWTTPTEASGHVEAGLKLVNNLMGFVKAGQGKPTAQERALFAASVVFTYGIWENYVEQLALELSQNVAPSIKPEGVPPKVKKQLETKAAWDLAVSPGWRALWIGLVKSKALGDEKDKFGMNTASYSSVSILLELAGVEEPFSGIPATISPDHLKENDRTVQGSIDALVALRGEIVHTGKVPETLIKSHVVAWRDFIKELAKALDKSCRDQCSKLLG